MRFHGILGKEEGESDQLFQVSGTFFDHRTVSVYQNNPKCDPSNIGAVHKSKQIYSYLAFLRPTWSKLTLETVSIQSSRACSCNNFRCWPPVCTCPYHQISKQSNFGPYWGEKGKYAQMWPFIEQIRSKLTLETVYIQTSKTFLCQNLRCCPPLCTWTHD